LNLLDLLKRKLFQNPNKKNLNRQFLHQLLSNPNKKQQPKTLQHKPNHKLLDKLLDKLLSKTQTKVEIEQRNHTKLISDHTNQNITRRKIMKIKEKKKTMKKDQSSIISK
jgi:hypothetical protein